AVARLVCVPVPDHSQKYFMRQILRRRLPPGQPVKEPEQRAISVFVDSAHARDISARDGGHQFMVGGLRCPGSLRHHFALLNGPTALQGKSYKMPATRSAF